MTKPAKTQTSIFEKAVTAKDAGTRIDLWLRDQNPTWSRKKIKQLLDARQVLVNRQLVYVASWALKAGDRVSIQVEPAKQTSFVSVVYEDAFILAIDKSPYQTFDEAIDNVRAYLKRKEGPNYRPTLQPLHRLDRQTSGVFLIAKDPRALALIEQFKTHTLKKIYIALVQGQIPFFEKRITSSIKKGEFKGGKKVEVAAKASVDGKHAQTDFHVLERYRTATLLEVSPRTGRTHQIRAHLSSLGYPLVGDSVYGKADGKSGLSFPRHALHASQIQFIHPTSGKKLKLTAPLPKDLQGLVDRLRLA